MEASIRHAVEKDKSFFVDFALKLSRFNRGNHSGECKYDDYEMVADSIKRKAEETFDSWDENILILIAEVDGRPAGYALGRIFEEEDTADNGTGRMGLFDELFVDEAARGLGLGQKLMDEAMKWFKDKGIARVKLHAYTWNGNAKRLYEHNGFHEYAVSYEKFI